MSESTPEKQDAQPRTWLSVVEPGNVILEARALLRVVHREKVWAEELFDKELDWTPVSKGAEGPEAPLSLWTGIRSSFQRWDAAQEEHDESCSALVREVGEHPRSVPASLPGRYYGTAIAEGRRVWEKNLASHPGDPVVAMFAALFYSSWNARRGHQILDACEQAGGDPVQILFCRAAQHIRVVDPEDGRCAIEEVKRKALALLEQATRLCGDTFRERRLSACALEDQVSLHCALRGWQAARECAGQLIALNTGGDVHLQCQVRHAHQRLGLLHLIEGEDACDLEQAVACLRSAGELLGADQSPPEAVDWNLAHALFRKGQRDHVIEYLELCRAAWPEHAERVDGWIAQLRRRKAPKPWSDAREFRVFERYKLEKSAALWLLVLQGVGMALLAIAFHGTRVLYGVLRLLWPGRLWKIYRLRRELDRGNPDLAMERAERLLHEAKHKRSPAKRDSHLCVGHLLRGRCFLAQGRTREAAADLLEAGTRWTHGTMDPGQLPDMALARGLWAAGERDAVLEYFALCGQRDSVARRASGWIAVLEDGPATSSADERDASSASCSPVPGA